MKITDSVYESVHESLVGDIKRMEQGVRNASDAIRRYEETIRDYQAEIRNQQEYINSCRIKIKLFQKALDELDSEKTNED